MHTHTMELTSKGPASSFKGSQTIVLHQLRRGSLHWLCGYSQDIYIYKMNVYLQGTSQLP